MNLSVNPIATALLSVRLPGNQSVEIISRLESAPGNIESLTHRLAAGDEKAFVEFHQEYFDRLYQFLLVITQGREDEAKEALQQTLLRVVRYVRPFNCEETFWCWLKGVSRSVARDAGRKERRYWGLLNRFSLSKPTTTNTVPDPEQSLRAELDDCLCELVPEDRLLLVSKYIEGATVKELSLQTGLTEKAIESRLLRLRRRLRETLLRRLNSL
jgi:RNA polymerase sigma-70 factor (ECF subfamily)